MNETSRKLLFLSIYNEKQRSATEEKRGLVITCGRLPFAAGHKVDSKSF